MVKSKSWCQIQASAHFDVNLLIPCTQAMYPPLQLRTPATQAPDPDRTHPLLLQLAQRVQHQAATVVVRPPPPLPTVQHHVGHSADVLQRLNRCKVVQQPLLVQVGPDHVAVAVRVRVVGGLRRGGGAAAVQPVAPAGGHGDGQHGPPAVCVASNRVAGMRNQQCETANAHPYHERISQILPTLSPGSTTTTLAPSHDSVNR